MGRQTSTSPCADLAASALEMAVWARRREGADLTGLIHHSDRGVQYRAIRYGQTLAQCEATSGGLLAGPARILPGDSGTGLRPALLVCALIPVLYALAVLAVGRTGRGRAERSQALRSRRG